MLFSTPAQWLVLALVLVGGWLLGLATHPGGRKWKTRYLAERDAHAAHRREVDARLAEADRHRTECERDAKGRGDLEARLAEAERRQSEVQTRLAEAERRRTELEAENARLARAAPITTATIRPSATARPAYPTGEKRGWFDWGPAGQRRPL